MYQFVHQHLKRTKQPYVVTACRSFSSHRVGLKTEFKQTRLHPGVIVSRKRNEGHKFEVARISHSYPFDQKEPIRNFHKDSTLDGNVDLGTPKVVGRMQMKPWRDETGYAKSMSNRGVKKLKLAICKWHPPASFKFYVVIRIQRLHDHNPRQVSLQHQSIFTLSSVFSSCSIDKWRWAPPLCPERVKPYYAVQHEDPVLGKWHPPAHHFFHVVIWIQRMLLKDHAAIKVSLSHFVLSGSMKPYNAVQHKDPVLGKWHPPAHHFFHVVIWIQRMLLKDHAAINVSISHFVLIGSMKPYYAHPNFKKRD